MASATRTTTTKSRASGASGITSPFTRQHSSSRRRRARTFPLLLLLPQPISSSHPCAPCPRYQIPQSARTPRGPQEHPPPTQEPHVLRLPLRKPRPCPSPRPHRRASCSTAISRAWNMSAANPSAGQRADFDPLNIGVSNVARGENLHSASFCCCNPPPPSLQEHAGPLPTNEAGTSPTASQPEPWFTKSALTQDVN
ncbi:hypothetical protein C8R47DRAFT_300343 [Mycena vitilis]|nr:hypothetical protein C8R47DRAFT_300343 [Mycena vitilis]